MSIVKNCFFGMVFLKVCYLVKKYLIKVVRIICLIYFKIVIEYDVFRVVD